MTTEEPQPTEKYVHFKGKDKIYEIIAVARDCDNLEKRFVIYKALYDSKDFSKGTIFSRSLEDFCGFKLEQGKKIKRFTKLE